MLRDGQTGDWYVHPRMLYRVHADQHITGSALSSATKELSGRLNSALTLLLLPQRRPTSQRKLSAQLPSQAGNADLFAAKSGTHTLASFSTTSNTTTSYAPWHIPSITPA